MSLSHCSFNLQWPLCMICNHVKSWLKLYGSFFVVLLGIVGWAAFFYFISPDEVVRVIGIQNSYLVVFILAVICGFSSFTATTFFVAIAALSQGGANPLLLGLSGGVGLCVSDFAFYFVVSRGTPVIDKHWKKLSTFLRHWITVLPDWIIYPFIFLYSTFAPLPNDIILVALAFGGYPFKKIAPFLFLGDIASAILLAYVAH